MGRLRLFRNIQLRVVYSTCLLTLVLHIFSRLEYIIYNYVIHRIMLH